MKHLDKGYKMEAPALVLYEDNHILCVDKPFGLLTQDSGTGLENLEDQIKSYYKELLNKKGDVYLKLLHRLDCLTGGLVLFAKSKKALSRLLDLIRKKEWEKTYLVALEGALPQKSGNLENYISHGNKQAFITEEGEEGSKLALLSYKWIKSENGVHYYNISLETGRYHQIRCQLSHLGCPIWGDEKYGSTKNFTHPGISLKHIELKVWHPVQQRELIVTAPMPNWF